MLLFNIFLWLILIVFLFVLIILFFWAWTVVVAKVPFISVPTKTLKEISNAINLKDNSVFYDLGCGDGRVIFYLAKKYPNNTYIGIENNPFAYYIAKFRLYFFNKKNKINIRINKNDFFKENLSEATHIFTYLYPSVMDELLPKLDIELKKGTKFISASFQFTVKRDFKEIDLKRGEYQLVKKIFIYEF